MVNQLKDRTLIVIVAQNLDLKTRPSTVKAAKIRQDLKVRREKTLKALWGTSMEYQVLDHLQTTPQEQAVPILILKSGAYTKAMQAVLVELMRTTAEVPLI